MSSISPVLSRLSSAHRILLQRLQPVAVLYQYLPAPSLDGIVKPMKPGGYSDGSADIAAALMSANIQVLTHTEQQTPDETQALDWVHPDTQQQMLMLIQKGVRTLWANTVLYAQHPLQYLDYVEEVMVVGQAPKLQQKYDNKLVTNLMLTQQGIPTPKVMLIGHTQSQQQQYHPLTVHPHSIPVTDSILSSHGLSLPVVVKPIRGRGSAGVLCVSSLSRLNAHVQQMLQCGEYGDSVMVEEYLDGEELTITVMPPGSYTEPMNSQPEYWCLPIVQRSQHVNGVLPYSGLVPVIDNSIVLDKQFISSDSLYQRVLADCVSAACLLRLTSCIRIDCRADTHGRFKLFDLNVKPNLTGVGRRGRDNASSLVALAAAAIGWDFPTLLVNMLLQARPLKQLQQQQ